MFRAFFVFRPWLQCTSFFLPRTPGGDRGISVTHLRVAYIAIMKTLVALGVSAVLMAAASAQTSSALDSLYLNNKLYSQQVALWSVYRTSSADVVMLGNSITQGTNWNELLGRPTVVNRGIGSDNLVGFLHRMQFVTQLHPKICCVMGGINDIYAGFTVEQIIRNYGAVLDTLVAAGITPVVQSTLNVSSRWRDADAKNRIVADLDQQLRALCAKRGIDFLDLTPVLCPAGQLLESYTTDGIHLTAAGYAVWATMLDEVLRRHGV